MQKNWFLVGIHVMMKLFGAIINDPGAEILYLFSHLNVWSENGCCFVHNFFFFFVVCVWAYCWNMIPDKLHS